MDSPENINSNLEPCRRKILVVDDDKQIRDVFATILAGEISCEVDVAKDGIEACNLFAEQHYAVIVMDMHMPTLGGMEAFARIRAYCEAARLAMPAVIFCTAYDPPNTLQNLLSQDSNHTLVRKPVSNNDLVALVHKRLPT
ncbi:MAG: response regulator [Lentisphaerae bacterium]|nr:response regulator [Lentisphaerota bacterium]